MSNESRELTCPKCNCAQVQTLRMAYEGGTTHSESTTSGVGVGMSGGGLGVGVLGATTRGTNMSLIAQKVAPPQPKSLMPAVACIAVGGILVAGGIGSGSQSGKIENLVVGLIVGIALIVSGVSGFLKTTKWNNTELPRLSQEWEDSWICQKCGNIFRP